MFQIPKDDYSIELVSRVAPRWAWEVIGVLLQTRGFRVFYGRELSEEIVAVLETGVVDCGEGEGGEP